MTTKKTRIKTNNKGRISSTETGAWIGLPDQVEDEETLAVVSEFISPSVEKSTSGS